MELAGAANLWGFIQIQHLLLFNDIFADDKLSEIYPNTTLVAVHRGRETCLDNCSNIQIQYLLLFNNMLFVPVPRVIQFKYNTCYCSTHVNKGFLKNVKAQKPYIYAIF